MNKLMAEIVVLSTEEPTKEQVLALLDRLREAMKLEIAAEDRPLPWMEWVHKDATLPVNGNKDQQWVKPYGDQWHYGYFQLMEKDEEVR